MPRTQTAVRRDRRDENRWLSAAVAGLAGGVAFGLYLQFVVEVSPLAGPAQGIETMVTEWVVHLFHSLVFALVYAELVSWSPLSDYADRAPTGAVLGTGYGVVVWAVATVVVVAFLAIANTVWILSVPNVSLENLVGHVLYGVVLGAVFAAVRRESG
jgi:uncharacterized membrane protein YagU involved in acid resistance